MSFKEEALKICEQLQSFQIQQDSKEIGFILKEINLMINSFAIGVEFSPSYPRIIVDSWDLNDKLSEDLMRLYQVYRKIWVKVSK